ncbi:class I SAM-dependent methyltransferase [Enhygromyxa salina]|uniref:Putative methyltransferase YcgJ n=1 Tax=Enhygromyxa salina TaxID=215803 RepID=A0A2S9YWE7_9BACT|nr:class I SAM-dependent methyltransferase [Enhygromyxa salina]PRQ09416.1 putative methyltransferase YcgJ [Enhygromyxa salina]
MGTDVAFWNNLAETYARKPVENPSAFDRKIEITKARMRPGDVVLDIGCGTGSLALRLAPFAAQIYGLDISTEMVRIANDKARTQGVDNVSFQVSPFDPSWTAFEPESLDGICAYSLLHLVEDRTAALDQIYRLLKPGGFFISSTACLGETWVPYRPLLTVMRWLGKAPRAAVISKQTLAAEVQRAGFVDISQPEIGAAATTCFMVAAKGS